MKYTPFVFILTFFIFSCEKKKDEKGNPPADGFDLAHSDPAAIELADSIMIAMGGRENWDKTRFISWNAFGEKSLVWDKQTGRVRMESPENNTVYLVNLNTGEGRVQIDGKEESAPDSLKNILHDAKSMCMDELYWLAMPFKLKDAGITLKYMGEDTLKGSRFNVLQVKFQDTTGIVTQYKYRMYVDVKEKLVRYWTYYIVAGPNTIDFVDPWDNYKKYGNILLSGDRSDGDGPKNIKVDEALPDKIFTEF